VQGGGLGVFPSTLPRYGITLAYPSAETLLVTHVSNETFIVALNDSKLKVMKQEPQNVEAALSHAIKLEAFEQSLTY